MVNYECYRCGYTNINKSNIVCHIGRKNTCNPVLNDINLDDYKDYILKGILYKNLKHKSILSPNNPNKSIINPVKLDTSINFECKFKTKYFDYTLLNIEDENLEECLEGRERITRKCIFIDNVTDKYVELLANNDFKIKNKFAYKFVQ